MSLLLAIDVGTLSARAGLFDASGRLVTARSHPFELLRPAENHAVYRMDDIWAAVCAAIRAAISEAPGAAAAIAGIAVDATSSTFFEAKGERPLEGDADVICWMDHRGEREAEEIGASGDRYLDHVGGTVSPEMYLPKILWVKRHRPEAWARITAVRDLSDEVARRLTGVDRHSVCGLACKFPYLPADPNPWRRELLAALGLSDLLQRGNLAEPPGRVGEVQGTVSSEAAQALGIAPGAPVAIGLIDAEAGALGVASRGFRDKMNRSLALIGGTSTCYMCWAEDERHISGIWGPFKDAIFPGYWMHEAGMSISGAALDTVLDQHPASPGKASAERHAEAARDILALLDLEGPAFAARRHVIPDWLGNRAPYGDGTVRALVSGIGLETSPRSFLEHYYATARALALQSRHIREHLNAHGYAIDRVCLSGGHAKNPLMVRLYRDALGADLVISHAPEPVLLGTAMVAAVAAGLHPDLFAALDAMAPEQTIHTADPTWATANDVAYSTYLKLFAIRNEIEVEGRRLAGHPSASTGVF
ncbi:FGGY-family carbohydrate kinase [Bradyrhizobium australiense]|uniref:Ribulokinase n=1 Tax=Bradyrhizobium australiense TaxID=2721161 RepID=A0A7Y4GX79_9BRAD|nr:FGGY-family carbohydrate kinase [Bradyrhizobium australiense]NOJ43640.1 ribulokinase [Bradyrhizobium australiense]